MVSASFAARVDEQRIALQTGLHPARVPRLAYGLSLSVLIAHLRKLRALGILDDHNDGKMAYYSLRATFAADLVTRALAAAAA